jgi:hypothetical protein
MHAQWDFSRAIASGTTADRDGWNFFDLSSQESI